MAGSIQGKAKIVESLKPVAVTSDATDGAWVTLNGYNRALIICSAGTPTAGDSDTAITFTIYKDVTTTVVSDGSSDDEVAITAATQTIGLGGADSAGALGSAEFIDLEFVKHGLSTGLLRVTAQGAGAGTSVPAAATIVLYEPNGTHTDTAMTIVVPASS